MARLSTTTIEVNDPNCRGVTSSDGRQQYNKDRRGRITLPTHEAEKILHSGHADAHRYHEPFGNALKHAAQHFDTWAAEHPAEADALRAIYAHWGEEQAHAHSTSES